MNIESFREFCLQQKATSEGFPFDETTLVFKVGGKIFTITSTNGDFGIALKCDPEQAITLRETYPAVKPGYHLNKKHWNTITVDGTIQDSLLKEWIMDSYQLIVDKMPKKLRTEHGLG